MAGRCISFAGPACQPRTGLSPARQDPATEHYAAAPAPCPPWRFQRAITTVTLALLPLMLPQLALKLLVELALKELPGTASPSPSRCTSGRLPQVTRRSVRPLSMV